MPTISTLTRLLEQARNHKDVLELEVALGEASAFTCTHSGAVDSEGLRRGSRGSSSPGATLDSLSSFKRLVRDVRQLYESLFRECERYLMPLRRACHKMDEQEIFTALLKCQQASPALQLSMYSDMRDAVALRQRLIAIHGEAMHVLDSPQRAGDIEQFLQENASFLPDRTVSALMRKSKDSKMLMPVGIGHPDSVSGAGLRRHPYRSLSLGSGRSRDSATATPGAAAHTRHTPRAEEDLLGSYRTSSRTRTLSGELHQTRENRGLLERGGAAYGLPGQRHRTSSNGVGVGGGRLDKMRWMEEPLSGQQEQHHTPRRSHTDRDRHWLRYAEAVEKLDGDVVRSSSAAARHYQYHSASADEREREWLREGREYPYEYRRKSLNTSPSRQLSVSPTARMGTGISGSSSGRVRGGGVVYRPAVDEGGDEGGWDPSPYRYPSSKPRSSSLLGRKHRDDIPRRFGAATHSAPWRETATEDRMVPSPYHPSVPPLDLEEDEEEQEEQQEEEDIHHDGDKLHHRSYPSQTLYQEDKAPGQPSNMEGSQQWKVAQEKRQPQEEEEEKEEKEEDDDEEEAPHERGVAQASTSSSSSVLSPTNAKGEPAAAAAGAGASRAAAAGAALIAALTANSSSNAARTEAGARVLHGSSSSSPWRQPLRQQDRRKILLLLEKEENARERVEGDERVASSVIFEQAMQELTRLWCAPFGLHRAAGFLTPRRERHHSRRGGSMEASGMQKMGRPRCGVVPMAYDEKASAGDYGALEEGEIRAEEEEDVQEEERQYSSDHQQRVSSHRATPPRSDHFHYLTQREEKALLSHTTTQNPSSSARKNPARGDDFTRQPPHVVGSGGGEVSRGAGLEYMPTRAVEHNRNEEETHAVEEHAYSFVTTSDQSQTHGRTGTSSSQQGETRTTKGGRREAPSSWTSSLLRSASLGRVDIQQIRLDARLRAVLTEEDISRRDVEGAEEFDRTVNLFPMQAKATALLSSENGYWGEENEAIMDDDDDRDLDDDMW